MLKIRSYFLIALVVYSITVLSGLPSSILTNPLADSLKPHIELKSSSGTIWKGGVEAVVSSYPVELKWNWHLWEILILKVSTDLHLKSEILEAKSGLRLGLKTIEVEDLSGLLKTDVLNEILRKQGVRAKIENDVYFHGINLKRVDTKFSTASGKADWQGGTVVAQDLPEGELNLPALVALLANDEAGLVLAVVTKDGNQSLVDLLLSNDGVAHLKLKERVDQFVEIPDEIKVGEPDNVMFEIKRQIFDTQGKF